MHASSIEGSINSSDSPMLYPKQLRYGREELLVKVTVSQDEEVIQVRVWR